MSSINSCKTVVRLGPAAIASLVTLLICAQKSAYAQEHLTYESATKEDLARGLYEGLLSNLEFDRPKFRITKRNFDVSMPKSDRLNQELELLDELPLADEEVAETVRKYRSNLIYQINALDDETEHIRMEQILITGSDLQETRLNNSTSSVSNERR